MAYKKAETFPGIPTVEELNLPGGFFNPAYNVKLAAAKRERARARKVAYPPVAGDSTQDWIRRYQEIDAERGTLKAENERLRAAQASADGMEETQMEHEGFTPGPWGVDKPFGEPGVYVQGPTTALICKLYVPDAGTFNVDKRVTIEANARLIASAPSLLTENERLRALLQEVCFAYDDESNTTLEITMEALPWATIRAAIAAKNDPDCPGGTECECDKG